MPTHQALTKTGSLSKSSTRDLKEQGLSGSPAGSPEQLEVLERFEPVLGAVMALEEELSEG